MRWAGMKVLWQPGMKWRPRDFPEARNELPPLGRLTDMKFLEFWRWYIRQLRTDEIYRQDFYWDYFFGLPVWVGVTGVILWLACAAVR